ncbi:MAG: glutamate synthase-related protein [Paracoccaceae bacterium]
MIELKMSQRGSGHGGALPAAKITPRSPRRRGGADGVDCVSPAAHPEFPLRPSMMELLAGWQRAFRWQPRASSLRRPPREFKAWSGDAGTGIVPDFIVVDGKEGAAALARRRSSSPTISDTTGADLVHNTPAASACATVKIAPRAAHHLLRILGTSRRRLGQLARGFMFAVGCIQASPPHQPRPAGGHLHAAPARLDAPRKTERVYRFHHNTLKAIAEMTGAAGLDLHPGSPAASPDHP